MKYLPDYITEARGRVAAGMSVTKAARILRWASGYHLTQYGAEDLVLRGASR